MISILENTDPIVFGERLRIARTKTGLNYRKQPINSKWLGQLFSPLKKGSVVFEKMSFDCAQRYMVFP